MILLKYIFIRFCSCFILDKEKRRNYRKNKINELFSVKILAMTYLVKDESDIIKTGILFHKAMGVDKIIVTDNNSTDGTLELLKELLKDGIIDELIDKRETTFKQREWVDHMIKIAKKKFKADWVINCDADEFWYSSSMNLKIDIAKDAKKYANVLCVYLKNFVPVKNEDNYLNSTYFIQRPLQEFEKKIIGVDSVQYDIDVLKRKIIHKTDGYVQIVMGNHNVRMNKTKEIFCPSITVYHYFIRNYKYFEKKTINGGEACKNYLRECCCGHWKDWYSEYKKGNLMTVYNNYFNLDKIDDLIKFGAICQDSAIINFLKYKNIEF